MAAPLVTLTQTVRRNFLANTVDGALFLASMAIVTPNTVLSTFVKELGGSNTLVALTPSVLVIGWVLPQLFIANYTESLPKKKPFVLFFGLAQRLPWALLAAITFGWGPEHPERTLAAFVALYFLSGFFSGLATPGWMAMVSAVTPLQRRGMLFAWRTLIGNLLGILSGALVAFVLGSVPFPRSYGWLFSTCFVGLMASWIAVTLVQEAPGEAPKRRLKTRAYLERVATLLQRDRAFARYLGATLLCTAGSVGMAFCTVDALARFGLPDAAAGTFTMLLTLGQILGGFVFGRMGDQRGHKGPIVLSGLFAAAAYALMALRAPLAGYYAGFLLLGLSVGAALISRTGIIVEFGPPEDRPTYVGLSNTIQAPVIVGVPFVAGWIADALGYGAVFALAATLTALGTWLTARMPDPRHGAVAHAPRMQQSELPA